MVWAVGHPAGSCRLPGGRTDVASGTIGHGSARIVVCSERCSMVVPRSPRRRLGRLLSPPVRSAWVALLLLVYIVGAIVQPLAAVRAQTAVGATLTVLRGNVGVLRSDGSPISPAASGLTLGPGDQVAT